MTGVQTCALPIYIICQLPEGLQKSIGEGITAKSAIFSSGKYYSLIGYDAYQAYAGLVIIQRTQKMTGRILYDFIIQCGEHLCYTGGGRYTDSDGNTYDGFAINGKIQLISLTSYDSDTGAYFFSYPESSGTRTYMEDGYEYACQIVYANVNMYDNDGTYSHISFKKTNSDLSPHKKFNWGDHLTGTGGNDSQYDITFSEDYDIKNPTSTLNITVKGAEFSSKLFYSNVAPGVDGNLKTKTQLPLNGNKATLELKAYQSLYFQLEDVNR